MNHSIRSWQILKGCKWFYSAFGRSTLNWWRIDSCPFRAVLNGSRNPELGLLVFQFFFFCSHVLARQCLEAQAKQTFPLWHFDIIWRWFFYILKEEFYKKVLGRQDGFGRFLNARRICCPNSSEIHVFLRTNIKMQMQVVKLQLLLGWEWELNQSFCM